jgi:C4-dicarboxylate-specific signal transduction histidine kinase
VLPLSEGARPVDPLPVLHDVAAAMSQRYPHVQIACREALPGAAAARVAVGGGERGLRRIAESAIANACEGNGAAGAHAVDVVVSREPALRLLAIEVRDDGPGFPPALLRTAISPFATTKRGASGLGLYTAERLARAGGGFLRRENPRGGGARLRVFLPEVPGT